MIKEPYADGDRIETEALMSPGQAVAIILMAPWIFLWAADYYGFDALGWLLRAMGVTP